MSRYEKALLLLLLLFLGLNIAGFEAGRPLFFLGFWVLAASYLLGSFWLFNQEHIAVPIRIIAGIAFATAVVSVGYTSGFNLRPPYKELPAVNAVFCIGLGSYLWLHRREPAVSMLRGLWLRSALLLVISAFFAYCPIGFWPYRKAIIALNHGQKTTVSNIRMFDYLAQYNEAMERKDYPAATTYGRQALLMGKQWLGEDSVRLRWKIGGAYTNVYTAYRMLGDAEYAQRQYQKALQAFQTGHAFLVAGEYRETGTEASDMSWKEEQVWSMNNMAFCFLKLRRFGEGDSLFVGAIKAYKKVYPTPDVYSARLVSDLATSLTAQREFNGSNELLLSINRFLAKDTARKAATMLATNAINISLNYIQQDSLPKALRVLQTITYPRRDTTANRYKAGTQEAVCLYRLERYEAAVKALQQPLAYYKRHARDWEAVALCEVLLAKNNLALASYSRAQDYANAAQAILLAEKQGAASSLNGSCLSVLSALNKTIGNYKVADQQLTKAVAAVRQDTNHSAGTLSEALAQLADLDVMLGREAAAREHVDSALALLLQGKPMELPSQTSILATAAYVDYSQGHYMEAGRKYRQVVAINFRYGQGQNANTATAWNGLGLVKMAEHRYEQADSVFQQAQRLHEKIFTEQHPLTANVYLNYGLLRLKQNRRADAESFFEKASSIAKAFLPANHDMFGDLAIAMGDLAIQEKQASIAHGYYEKAFSIYSQKFPAFHWKVREARKKAGN